MFAQFLRARAGCQTGGEDIVDQKNALPFEALHADIFEAMNHFLDQAGILSGGSRRREFQFQIETISTREIDGDFAFIPESANFADRRVNSFDAAWMRSAMLAYVRFRWARWAFATNL